jgi:single-strand DNA-binding protein
MNEISFTGNVSKIHETRHKGNGETIFSFDLAVENGYWDKTREKWISRTRFQPVVTFRELAANVEQTLKVGMAVTVTGLLLDDSFVPKGGAQYPVRRDKLEATDVAISLRRATAVVTKTGKSREEEGREHNRQQLATAA